MNVKVARCERRGAWHKASGLKNNARGVWFCAYKWQERELCGVVVRECVWRGKEIICVRVMPV